MKKYLLDMTGLNWLIALKNDSDNPYHNIVKRGITSHKRSVVTEKKRPPRIKI